MPGIQTTRICCLLIATFFYFSALKTIPLADALAIYFIYPFIITVLAGFMLGEKVGIRRYIAVLVGILGTLVIVRPGFQAVPVGVWFLLAAAFCFAFYNIFTRKLVKHTKPGAILLFQSLFGTVVMTSIVPFYWQMPDLVGIGLFLTMGLVSAFSHYLLILSYRFANASFLAPFAYFEIISTTFIGFVFFGDFPDAWTWFGIAIIVTCGIYILFREKEKT